MSNLLPFFVVLLVAVFFSEAYRRLHLPWVVALIGGGILVGPNVLGVFEPDTTMEFLGRVGLVFLMFMVGLEVKLSSIKEMGRSVGIFTTLNGLIPFIAGIVLGLGLGYGIYTALLIGVIFISSSVAIIATPLEKSGLLYTKVGKIAMSGTVFADILSLLALSILLQATAGQDAAMPWPIMLLLFFLSLIVLKWLIPKISWFFLGKDKYGKELFQQEMRLIFAVLMGVVIIFEFLEVHDIVAGFFAGLVLSDSIKSSMLREKLRDITYSLFVPIFFILVGAKTDITVFSDAILMTSIVLLIFTTIIISKLGSGYLAGRILGFPKKTSLFMGFCTISQLFTTLAVAFAGFEIGLLDQKLLTGLITVSLLTTFIGPLAIKIMSKQIKQEEKS